MLKSKTFWGLLLAVGVVLWLGLPGVSTGRRPDSSKYRPPTDVAKHLDGDVNYRASWTPTVDGGGPAMIALAGSVTGTTASNPYWHAFTVPPGTVVQVTATALNTRGGRPGWVECWLFDRHGKLLAHTPATDQASGCTVRGTA